MSASRIAWLAMGFGLLLMVLLLGAGAPGAGPYRLPLLLLLMASELGFLATLAGAYQAFKCLRSNGRQLAMRLVATGCLGLAIAFAWIGLGLWLGMGA